MPSPAPVEVRRETIVLPTYEPQWPDPNPMFLEKRVYQGSSGRVYPLPFTDRIAEKAAPRAWQAIYIENEYIRIMILPELGGRIHRAQDKTNGYDLIYYQSTIKPALVGLAGPWISGGIEINWPQHHRPSTFMPTDVEIERHSDGSATVWLSEHEPMSRMKGMHGVRLHPHRSYLELVVRVYNRTEEVQTFLWWANVATRVHEHYQSFFPPDVAHVADHAKRAISSFPLCAGDYYGIHYGDRTNTGIPATEQPRQFSPVTGAVGVHGPAGEIPCYKPNDLSWYANIPVPTSYMCMGSEENFSGGYDYKLGAGLVQVANHHISPGKKQWTWGNHDFGYAWDRNLTEPDESGVYSPYIELMVGVYTDNQPDFSFLQPGETKSWSQCWYPICAIGPVQKATVDAAISLRVAAGIARIGVQVTTTYIEAVVDLRHRDKTIAEWQNTLSPGRPLVFEVLVPAAIEREELTLRVSDREGCEIVSYSPRSAVTEKLPAPAHAPPPPRKVVTADELYQIGLHLEQYRHATSLPEPYWNEALRRDPSDSRCNLALGRWRLKRGEFEIAERHLRTSIARLTSRNPNPYDGEAHYQLGLCLRQQAFAASLDPIKLEEAYGSFYKATWNMAWQSAAFHALAEIDLLRQEWTKGLEHLERSLKLNTENLRARDLKVVALRKLGREAEAAQFLDDTLKLDPLDWWARSLKGDLLACDLQVRFDLALDCARAGLFAEALAMLAEGNVKPFDKTHGSARAPAIKLPTQSLGAQPMVHYYRAWLAHFLGDEKAQARHLASAAKVDLDYCFPARLEEIGILQSAIKKQPLDSRAPFYLGHLLYDRRRHREAIVLWQRVVKLEPKNAVAWRNLGIGYFNILQDTGAASDAYTHAVATRPNDARLLYERDQLRKRRGEKPEVRLRELSRHPELVQRRDDLSVEICSLYNQTGAPEKAFAILSHRKFQPWEGGEGQALGQHVRTQINLGRRALKKRAYQPAVDCFRHALTAPNNLGEAKHVLSNQSDIYYWLGCALAAARDLENARLNWTLAAEFKGDFQAMSVRRVSEMTYYSALACKKLGRVKQAKRIFRAILDYASRLTIEPPAIDYFATSLPTMLLFDEDLEARQKTTALFLEAQARFGLGETRRAKNCLKAILRIDPNHALAADLLA